MEVGLAGRGFFITPRGFPSSLFRLLSGSVHRSVAGSLNPVNITLLLYITSHFSFVNSTLQPCLHSTRMPISEAIVRCGTMCPVRITGNPGMLMSHSCVEVIRRPSGRLILIGLVVMRLFWTLSVSMTKMDVAPVSAMAWLAAMIEGVHAVSAFVWATRSWVEASTCCELDSEFVFDVTTVTSSSSNGVDVSITCAIRTGFDG